MKALFINGSPRKNKNTAQLLTRAMEGAADAGAETELINLFSLEYTGCKSCFACKLKNAKTNGVCALKDDLRPVLEKAHAADVLVVGSPVYYGYPTGQLRSFMERFLFPIDTYLIDDKGERVKILKKTVPTGLIYTMNVPQSMFSDLNYETLLGFTGEEMGRMCGYNEILYCMDTYQFNDYSEYDINLFSEEEKRAVREKQFPQDLEKAYEMGKHLVQLAENL